MDKIKLVPETSVRMAVSVIVAPTTTGAAVLVACNILSLSTT